MEQGVPYTREWAELQLAVTGLTGALGGRWTEKMHAEMIARVGRQWADAGLAVMGWERARGQRGTASAQVSVRVIAPPASAPHVTPAERGVEDRRDKIEGNVEATLAAKNAAVEPEVEKRAAAPDQVKRVAGWAWIRRSGERLSNPIMAFH